MKLALVVNGSAPHYNQAHVALRQRGYLVLVVKDHIRDGERVATAAMTVTMCESLGFKLHASHQRHLHNLSLWRRRRKERGEPVFEEEDVLVLKKGESSHATLI